MALKIFNGPADDLPHFLAIICNDNFLECMWHPIMHDFPLDIHTQVFLDIHTQFFLLMNKSFNLSKKNPIRSIHLQQKFIYLRNTMFTIRFLSFTDFFYYSTVLFDVINILKLKKTRVLQYTQHSSRLSE